MPFSSLQRLWAWGSNKAGSLCVDDNEDRLAPVQVQSSQEYVLAQVLVCLTPIFMMHMQSVSGFACLFWKCLCTDVLVCVYMCLCVCICSLAHLSLCLCLMCAFCVLRACVHECVSMIMIVMIHDNHRHHHLLSSSSSFLIIIMICCHCRHHSSSSS